MNEKILTQLKKVLNSKKSFVLIFFVAIIMIFIKLYYNNDLEIFNKTISQNFNWSDVQKIKPGIGINILTNPGLESPWEWHFFPELTNQIKSETPYSGEYYFGIEEPAGYIYQDIDISSLSPKITTSDYTITVSGSMYSQNPYQSSGYSYLDVYAYTDENSYVNLDGFIPVTEKYWSKKSKTWYLPPDTKKIRFFLHKTVEKKYTKQQKNIAYFDDVSLVISKCNKWEDKELTSEEEKAKKEFQAQCPKPDWWDTVPVCRPKFTNINEIWSYYNDTANRSNRQMFKAAYQAIIDYPLDANMVITAIYYIYQSVRYNKEDIAQAYKYLVSLHEFAVKRYFYHKCSYSTSTTTADCMARLVTNLVYLYNEKKKFEWSSALIEGFIKARESEISEYNLRGLVYEYAKALHEQGNNSKAIDVLKKDIEKYQKTSSDWNESMQKLFEKYSKKESK